jgi:hypothetical protein
MLIIAKEGRPFGVFPTDLHAASFQASGPPLARSLFVLLTPLQDW